MNGSLKGCQEMIDGKSCINVMMTKEMIIDIRKPKALPDPIIINDHTAERVCASKYFGVVLNNDHSWSNNTDYIISKLNSRLYCLRKVKKFNVNTCILKLFISWLSQMFLHIVVFVGVETLRRFMRVLLQFWYL